MSNQLHFRFATQQDVDLYFNWANDEVVRKNSYNQQLVPYQNHVEWFKRKLNQPQCHFYLFLNQDNLPVGQVRIDKPENEVVIGISIDANHRGKGYASEMLIQATNHYLQKHPQATIYAYIKKENVASFNSFVKAGFENDTSVIENDVESFRLEKKIISIQ
jgi:spore coat polysaccharide biosynthesis protein SpsF